MSKNNEPAFPFQEIHGDGTHYYSNEGMALRDYFAAKAMQALIAKSPFLAEPQNFEVHNKTAIGAYEYADAMLAARGEQP